MEHHKLSETIKQMLTWSSLASMLILSKILGSQKIIALSKMALMVFSAFGDPRKTHVQEGNGESTGGVLSQGYPILSSSWP